MLTNETKQWMLDNDFDPDNINQPGKYDDTALIAACRQGNDAVALELMDAGTDIHHSNMDGTTALWACVVSNHFELASSLLKLGADIDHQNDNGATVLMYASSSGKTPWVNYLLNEGANTALKSLDDFTALELASNIECLKLLKAARL